MFKNSALTLAAVAASLVAVTSPSFAGGKGVYRLHVQDANTGETLFDDGRDDGRGCAVGIKAIFDPATQTFKQKPTVKCNFK